MYGFVTAIFYTVRQVSLLKIDMRGILAGEQKLINIDFILTDSNPFSQDTLSNLYSVRFSTPVKVAGRLTSDAGYMKLSLELSVDYAVPCARCLEDVCGKFLLPVERTAVEAGVLENKESEESDEYVEIQNGYLDIDDLLLELLELNFPSKFLCSDDCLGLCPTCGKNLNEGPCTCVKKELDPRLEPLRKLLEEMKAEENSDK